jgi:hypothetical protein
MPLIKESCIKRLSREREELLSDLSRYRLMVSSNRIQIRKLQTEIKELKYRLSQSSSERRKYRRIIVSIVGNLYCDDKRYLCFIDNISEEGLHLRISPSKVKVILPPKKYIKLEFKVASGEKLELVCMKKWSYRTPPHGIIKCTGLKIINSPSGYKDFLNTLN